MFYNKADGKLGEKTAEKYLKSKGYLFISRNYWTDSGEVDLIFYRNFTLVFIEVKTRSNSEFGTGREAVDFNKRRNIKNAAKEFMRSHCKKNKVPFYVCKIPFYLKFSNIRYDVIEIFAKSRDEYIVNAHLENYFN